MAIFVSWGTTLRRISRTNAKNTKQNKELFGDSTSKKTEKFCSWSCILPFAEYQTLELKPGVMCFLSLALWNLNFPHVKQQKSVTITSSVTMLLSNLSLWRGKIFDLYPYKFCTIQLLASKYTQKKKMGRSWGQSYFRKFTGNSAQII